MTPTELRAAIATFGLTVRGFAHTVGVTTRTAERWVAEDRTIPETVARLVRAAIAHPEILEWLRAA